MRPRRILSGRAPGAILLLAMFLALAAVCVRPASAADVLRGTLENGLRVVIVRNVLAPVATTEINYHVGADEDLPGLPGMAHALEHMMFRGSPGLSADQLAALVAALGGDFNADTQQTVTQYFFTVPAADLDAALRVEAIRMKGVLATEALWELERGAIEQEVARDLSNPEYVFYTKLLAHMFAGTPYSHDALGTDASFNKLTGRMLRKHHGQWYAPNNSILIVVGDVDPEATYKKVRELFGPIPSRPVPERPEVVPQPLKPSEIRMETDLPYGLSVVAYRLPGFDSPDYAAGQILADLLGSQRGDLYALVPEGKALSADFSSFELPKASIGYATAAFPKGGDGEALVSMIKERVEKYVKGGVPPDLVEAAKRHEIADAEFQKNSIQGLADAWSQALAVEGRQSPEDDIEAMRKVTAEDVNRVARNYLLNDTATVAVLTPRAYGKAVPSAGFGGKESFAPKRVKHVSLPQWAKKYTMVPALPEAGAKPLDMTLSNGLRLVIRPETISDTVGVYGMVKSNPDLQQPRGKEGVADVLSGMFSYGTTTLDRLAFQKALDDIAANESAGTGFFLQVLSEHFERGVELLADNLLHPALEGPAFEVVQKETMESLGGLLQSPSYLYERALLKALYPQKDPTLRQATEKSVGSLSLDDVRAYHSSVFRPDMTTVVVIGKVTPDEARAAVQKYFGQWKAEGPKPATDLPPVPANGPSSAVVPDESRVQDKVTLSETLGLTRSDPDYYTLQVGRHVLAGAFYATRLYRDLREETGLVYTVEALLDAGKTRAAFSVVYACDPQNTSRARAIVQRDLGEMQKGLVTPVELRQAKTLLLRRIPLSESSTEEIAGTFLHLAREGLPLDEPVRAAKRYRETTAEQIRAAFSKWIRPEGFAQVTLGPPLK